MSVQIAPYYFSSQKRAFDLTLAVVLSIVLLPLIIIIGAAVTLTIGWPVIFAQKRVGQHKNEFVMFKFRTMYKDAHKDQKKLMKYNESPFPAFKMENDPRFRGIGRLLSKTGLDELPQLINILKGEMSFIGPRPLPPKEAAKLTGSWDFRYFVRPGIISYWALSDKRHKSLRHWQRLEKETLERGGLKNDFGLMKKALRVIIH